MEVETPWQFIDDLRIDVDGLIRRSFEHSLHLVNTSRDPVSSMLSFAAHYPLIKAAGGLVESSTGKYLFIHRRGWWDLPKGKIELGESALEAALRETEEETGLKGLRPIAPIPPTYHMYELKGRIIIKQTSWYAMKVEGEPLPQPEVGEDITDARWVSTDEIPSIISSSYSAIKRLVELWL